MGILLHDLIVSIERDRRLRQIQSHSTRPASPTPGTPIASAAKRRKVTPCQQDHDYYQGTKITRHSGPDLPENENFILDSTRIFMKAFHLLLFNGSFTWCHIHDLLPLADAARAGCVCRGFQRSWGCRTNLTFSRKTLGLTCGGDKLARIFTKIVGRIMRKHLGIGLKTFTLQYLGSCLKASHLNSWLRIAVTPGLEELVLSLPPGYQYYDFPCSSLLNGSGNSIRNLDLTCCAFHPMAGIGCFRKLYLSQVHITGNELECLLSNSFLLEELNLRHCDKIICLKILCVLNQLNYLLVFECTTLEVIESKAPNLCTVDIDGALIQLLCGDLLQVKKLDILCSFESNLVRYACAQLPLIMPNLETLGISSAAEILNTPILPAKYLLLKRLDICLGVGEGAFSPAYDYFSIAYFLDACPVLETFMLAVTQTRMKHDSIISGDYSHQLRQMMPGQQRRHVSSCIKNVKIIGFCSAKSMVELTCHILDNAAASLEHLMLDTIYDGGTYFEGFDRLPIHRIGHCRPIGRHMIKEASKALLAIEKYIVGKVPSRVKLNIKKPCSWCHAVK